MELVLHDELGRQEPLGKRLSVLRHVVHGAVRAQVTEMGGASEQHACFAAPRHHRELVDGGDEEVRELLIELLVDEQHG
ncbi:MAG: hypothetical protein HUU29_00560 [Planctomycetaceae bacterium]|nr:hypothetical protein [Planctomycetaceae bacterium]